MWFVVQGSFFGHVKMLVFGARPRSTEVDIPVALNAHAAFAFSAWVAAQDRLAAYRLTVFQSRRTAA